MFLITLAKQAYVRPHMAAANDLLSLQIYELVSELISILR